MNKQQGYLSIVMVIFITIIAGLCVGAAYLLTVAGNTNTNSVSFTKAFYLAEAGIQRAQRMILNPTLSGSANRSTCAGFSVTDTTTLNPPGEYSAIQSTTSGLVYAVGTTTNGALTTGSTSIPVVSSTGYAASGRIMIDKESIDYAAISGNSFIGLSRGADNTTIAAHATGVKVAQYQCNIQAKGGVPTIASPIGLATINAGLQMQEGWVVTNTPASNTAGLFRWNYPTEKTWTASNTTVTGGPNMLSMSAISHADIWAVGTSARFIHWDGASWVLTTVSPGVQYNGVSCNSKNDCHAVGANSGASPVLMDWNGTSWVRNLSISGTTARTILQDVHCDASNDCWAVGSDAGGGVFYHWTGAGWTGVDVSTLSAFTFNSVFCNSASNCWAVGSSATFGYYNGTTWSNANSFLTSVQYNSVFCNNSNDCWAVGNNSTTNANLGRWTGGTPGTTAWTAYTVAAGAGTTPILNAVACYNANDCWAGGNGGMLLHWDGSAWSIFKAYNVANQTINHIALIGAEKFPLSSWMRA